MSMRVATMNGYERGLTTLQKRQSELVATQEQLTSGKRIERASDDPTAAARAERAMIAQMRSASDQRAVVHLKLWEGLTFERIAGLLEIPLNTAASRYRYGLDKLRGQLRPLYDEIRDGTSSAPGTGGD